MVKVIGKVYIIKFSTVTGEETLLDTEAYESYELAEAVLLDNEYKRVITGDKNALYERKCFWMCADILEMYLMGKEVNVFGKMVENLKDKNFIKNVSESMKEEVDSINADKDSWWKRDVKEVLEKIKYEIYTEHCTMNNQNNTDYEKGCINGLMRASKIINKY